MSQDARLDEERTTARRAEMLNLPYIDTSQIANKQLYKDILQVAELERLRVVPIRADTHNISFGVTNTTSHQTMDQLKQRLLDQQITYSLISDTGFREYMRLYDPPKQVVYHDIEIKEGDEQKVIESVSLTLDQVRADDMLAYLVQQAHKLNASDIHVENQKDQARIRFRIDGVLHPIAKLSHEKNRMLISAVASAGNVSTASDQPQQGHIAQRLKMADGAMVDVNLRVETVPAINGMDIVMRLFNMNKSLFTLDRLGLSERERAVVQDIINKPSGLLLAVGPTGSGKTTTLYSVLNTLNSESRKIITIEDPVEYQFDGITQISVTTKNGSESHFADKLRAVLRLDPDIVMVGEIRDMDTAKTALQASLTGHLVLSTFHAASASAAVTRLMDVIGQNPLFVSAIRLIMAQRLVRRLDDATKQPHLLEPALKSRLQTIIETMPSNIERPNLDTITFFKPGKSEENPFGYKSQVALREQFTLTGEVEQLLATKAKPRTEEIENAAIKGGMLTMLHDGVLKAARGETSLEEVFRVLG